MHVQVITETANKINTCTLKSITSRSNMPKLELANIAYKHHENGRYKAL
jgi:hypothetical protein